MKYKLIHSEFTKWAKSYNGDRFHGCLCDPPYGLEFMGKEWDKFTPETMHHSFKRSGYGLPRFGAWTPRMDANGQRKILKSNKQYHEAATKWGESLLPLLYPGAMVLMFGGTRTYHRLASAIEDAGFEIRDCAMWLYGSGFPKSLNISKSITKEVDRQLREQGVTGEIKWK